VSSLSDVHIEIKFQITLNINDCKLFMNSLTEIDKGISASFQQGLHVIKITTASNKIIVHASLISDFLKRVKELPYNSLFYVAPLFIKVAYVYGCLNSSYNKSKGETITCYTRKLNTDTWDEWFVVNPYLDDTQMMYS